MLSEFKKRIAQASGANSKAKLNLANMNLHDKQVRALCVFSFCIEVYLLLLLNST